MKSRIPKAEQGRIRDSQRPGTGLEIIFLQKPQRPNLFFGHEVLQMFSFFPGREALIYSSNVHAVAGEESWLGALQVAGGQITLEKGVTAL